VTPAHIARVCKAACGISAADLLKQNSLQRARCLLRDEGLKAVDIAKRLGFSTPAYFTRLVKSHTGETPSTLRKKGQVAASTKLGVNLPFGRIIKMVRLNSKVSVGESVFLSCIHRRCRFLLCSMSHLNFTLPKA